MIPLREEERLADKLVRCKCGIILHVERKRHCCGVDWLEWYYHSPRRVVEEVEEDVSVVPLKKDRKNKSKRKSIPVKTRLMILERDGHRCVECGSTKELHIHHIWKSAFGGGNDIGNLVTLCKLCHIKQHANEPVVKLMMSRT